MNRLLLKALYRVVGDVVDITKHPDFKKGGKELDPRKRFLDMQRQRDQKESDVVKFDSTEDKVKEGKELTENERMIEIKKLGNALKGKTIDGGKVTSVKVSKDRYPMVVVTVAWPIDKSVSRDEDYYIIYREDDSIRIEYKYNKVPVGKEGNAAASEILKMVKNPYEVAQKFKKGDTVLYVLKNFKSPNPNDRYQGWAPDVGATGTYGTPAKAKEQIGLMAKQYGT
jgi:hypothetical protein